MCPNYKNQALGGDKITAIWANSIPLYSVTTDELKHGGSWKLTVSVVLLLTLKRTTDGASGAPNRGKKWIYYLLQTIVLLTVTLQNLPESQDVTLTTDVHDGSLFSCACTAWSSTPMLAGVRPYDMPPLRGRHVAPERPSRPSFALPPSPACSGGPHGSPHSQLQQTTVS